ncbi:hypothetical protein EVAR_4083_1 [Eumeta japonica]|uniref:Uncharacterized protein n=1 Tax=Eumeta variegata TaxID=151549 RepID=A0A4C1T6X6_EUMVA|nr:hypothetical protein EVAR_4083_1 [Eumeta japonica]
MPPITESSLSVTDVTHLARRRHDTEQLAKTAAARRREFAQCVPHIGRLPAKRQPSGTPPINKLSRPTPRTNSIGQLKYWPHRPVTTGSRSAWSIGQAVEVAKYNRAGAGGGHRDPPPRHVLFSTAEIRLPLTMRKLTSANSWKGANAIGYRDITRTSNFSIIFSNIYGPTFAESLNNLRAFKWRCDCDAQSLRAETPRLRRSRRVTVLAAAVDV